MKEQADFDLERVMDLFDTALTSDDQRVQSALRQLLTIVALRQTQEDGKSLIASRNGPLRQMQEDMRDLSRAINRLQEELYQVKTQMNRNPYPQPYTGTNPYTLSGTSYSSNGEISADSIRLAQISKDLQKEDK